MASEARLDQIVKGAPPPTAKPPPTPPMQLTSHPSSASMRYNPASDPLSALPSSPPQIYLNLLILESSLRAQYLSLLSRRRLHTFFILLLCLWNAFFTYALFLRPREDGHGLGGSVYWVVETLEKVALMSGIVAGLLVWGTGQWERGIRWPRRWVGTANRGLRGFNLRVVIVKKIWWRELIGHLAYLFPVGSLGGESGGAEWHMVIEEKQTRQHAHTQSQTQSDEESIGVNTANLAVVEEDLAPGGDHIKLLLLPKSFSPEFRENWEEYRADYWEKENERRALLLARVRHQQRMKSQETGGWMWWTGLWRMKPHIHAATSSSSSKVERQLHQHSNSRSSQQHQNLVSEKDLLSPFSHVHNKASTSSTTSAGNSSTRRRSLLRSADSSPQSSRQSSRSSTPHLRDAEAAEKQQQHSRPLSRGGSFERITLERLGSSSSDIRKKKATKDSSGGGSSSSSKAAAGGGLAPALRSRNGGVINPMTAANPTAPSATGAENEDIVAESGGGGGAAAAAAAGGGGGGLLSTRNTARLRTITPPATPPTASSDSQLSSGYGDSSSSSSSSNSSSGGGDRNSSNSNSRTRTTNPNSSNSTTPTTTTTTTTPSPSPAVAAMTTML